MAWKLGTPSDSRRFKTWARSHGSTMSQRNSTWGQRHITRLIFELSPPRVTLSSMSVKDSGDRPGESRSKSPAIYIPCTSGSPSSGKIKPGYLNSSGSIEWGPSFDLGPGLRKSFPVLGSYVDLTTHKRREFFNILGVLICTIPLFVYFF